MRKRCISRAIFSIALLLVLLLMGGPGRNAAAQGETADWGMPANLSRSGAAGQPRIAAAPDGRVQVFWWDRFDGLTTAVYDGASWSEPRSAPILQATAAGTGTAYLPAVGAMPTIVGDAAGWAHAFWIGKLDQKTGATPLWHSAMGIGGTSWSTPQALAESAVAFDVSAAPGNGISLVYARNLHQDQGPAGLYFRGSAGGPAGWATGVPLYPTIYFRLLTPEDAYVRVVDSGEGTIQAAWADPRLNQVLYARSTDDGTTWSAPEVLGTADQYPARPRIFALPGGAALRLWEGAGGCALYQQALAATAAPTATWSAAERVLETATTCPQGEGAWLEGDHLVWLWGQGSGGLALAAYDIGTRRWSGVRQMGVSFQDPATGNWVGLSDVQAAPAGPAIWAAGVDGATGEVWAVRGEESAVDFVWAPPPAWTAPAAVSRGTGWPGLPAIAADAQGWVHLLWSEASAEGEPGAALYYARFDGQRWSSPAAVLRAEEGPSRQAVLAAWQDRLYALWSGETDSVVLFSAAYTRDAYAAGGWSDPAPLPMGGSTGAWPQLVVDLAGRLHALYAVPLNEGRGIYYVRSDDGGTTWTEAAVVFDAAAARWALADHPALAVDEQGVIHAAWVRAPLPDQGLPEGLYYARSTDNGRSWTAAQLMADGNYDWPRLEAALTGQVHLAYNEVDGRTAAHHQWSSDGGATWSQGALVRGFERATGPVALAADGAGRIYLVARGLDDIGDPAVLYAAWDGARWGTLEAAPVPAAGTAGAGAAAAVQGPAGRLGIAVRGLQDGAGAAPAVWYLERAVEAVEALPAPAFTPEPSPTPVEPTPAPGPTERPAVNPAAPAQGAAAVELGPVTMPLSGVVGLVAATLLVGIILLGRGVQVRRKGS